MSRRFFLDMTLDQAPSGGYGLSSVTHDETGIRRLRLVIDYIIRKLDVSGITYIIKDRC